MSTSSHAARRPLTRWALFAVAYVLTLGLSVWFVIAVWEPADGPRWEQWVFALGVTVALALVAAVSALPIWLRLPRPGWYVAGAGFAALSALAATMLTFGLLFLPSLLLFVLAAANVYRALRVGGLGNREAAAGVVALIVVVWLVTGVYLPLVVLAAVVALAASKLLPRGR